MRILLLVALLLGTVSVKASSDIAEVAEDIVSRHVPADEWNEVKESADKTFKEWAHEHDDSTDHGRFLNEKLIEIACSVPKDITTLKRVVFWLALYRVYDEPLPAVVTRFTKTSGAKYLDDIEAIDLDFSWDKALALVLRRCKEGMTKR